MAPNGILDELHAARRQILADYDGDTAAYLRDAETRLKASARSIAQREQRAIRCAEATRSGESQVANHSSPPGNR